MDKIRQIAVHCTGRAVMFGTLAITCVMISFSFDPAVAFKAGAIMSLAMSGILLFKAATARSKDPRKTEVWLYLDKDARPREGHPQAVFSGILRDVYARFAQMTLAASVTMFAVSVVLSLAGVESTFR